MTISTLTIDDANLHNGAMNDPESTNPEVFELTFPPLAGHLT
jgi:hypothetical protein